MKNVLFLAIERERCTQIRLDTSDGSSVILECIADEWDLWNLGVENFIITVFDGTMPLKEGDSKIGLIQGNLVII